ncbi:flagellar basal body-associated FliL family protein, partial [Serratia marcescens]|uniref:flagellar basal body-associated FliL family protein n=1 Tax=Serratia marcescens TaxID=615 RepID=UPI0011E66759
YMKSSSINADRSTKDATAKKDKAKKLSDEIFVSLSDSVVTLHDADNDDHYMLVELAMVVDNDNAAKKIMADEPLYQSVIVSTLADMKYEQARAMKINELRALLTSAFNSELNRREATIPYNDILIKKVVFQ